MIKKAILILGASHDQVFMINTAHEMNLQTVVVDGNPNAVGLKIASYSKAIDFSNTQEVISYASDLIAEGVNICGVLTMGSDIPHIISKIAKYFAWVGPSEDTAKITTDKFLMKERFSQAGIDVPNYALVDNAEDVLHYWNKWGVEKLVIKPTDSAGSRGVSLLTKEQGLDKYFEHAKKFSKSNRVIVEEYIEGRQISTESIIYNNKIFHPGFADRVYDDTRSFYPIIMENGGWQPSNIDANIYNEICKTVEQVAHAIQLEKGVIKGDIVYSTKYKKVMVIEVASRLSGGDFSASLVPLSKAINYVKTALQIALGEVPNFKELETKHENVVANRYFFLPEGTLEDIINLDLIKNVAAIKKIEFNYAIGDRIPKILSHGQRVGVFVICDKDRESVQKTIDYVYETLLFKVDSQLFKGYPDFVLTL